MDGLDSYNSFVDRGIQRVIDEMGDVELGIEWAIRSAEN